MGPLHFTQCQVQRQVLSMPKSRPSGRWRSNVKYAQSPGILHWIVLTLKLRPQLVLGLVPPTLQALSSSTTARSSSIRMGIMVITGIQDFTKRMAHWRLPQKGLRNTIIITTMCMISSRCRTKSLRTWFAVKMNHRKKSNKQRNKACMLSQLHEPQSSCRFSYKVPIYC